MSEDHSLISAHPAGEQPLVEPGVSGPVPVDTYAGRIDVEWDPDAAVTPLGQLPFFIEFLKQAGLFDGWVGVVQNLPILGNTRARKLSSCEGRISVGWKVVLFGSRRALPAQARWDCSGPSPSSVSQWG